MYTFLSYAELPAEGKLMLLDFYSNLHNVSKVTIQDWIEENNPDIIMDNPTSPRLNDDDQKSLLDHIHSKKG